MQVFALVCVLASALVAFAADLPLTVTTTEGSATGTVFNDARVWFNLPFAKPPVGDLRFRAPQPPTAYDGGSYDASNYAAVACVQLGHDDSTEDCLYLDIAAPAEDDPVNYPDGYPVIFWIHGGALVLGSKNDGYEGSTFANNKVVWVGINYRLNLLGFLKVEENVPGNWGFLDQNQALKWVNSNIHAFGGDPSRITLMGQSAGALSVAMHISSPLSKGLFHQAILHSAYPHGHLPRPADALHTREGLATHTKCTPGDLNCLQALPVDELKNIWGTWYYLCLNNGIDGYEFQIDMMMTYCGVGPEVENDQLPDQLHAVFRSGKYNNVNMIVGLAWNEGLTDSNGIYNPVRSKAPELYAANELEKSKDIYIQWLNEIVDRQSYENNATAKTTLFSRTAQRIYNMYPYDPSSRVFSDMYRRGYNGFNPDKLDASYLTHMFYHDWSYHCPLRGLARNHVAAQSKRKNKKELYMYRFTQVARPAIDSYANDFNSDPATAVANDFYSLNLYTAHSSDVPFVYPLFQPNMGKKDVQVSNFMIETWVNFVNSGNPNVGPFKGPDGVWGRYLLSRDNVLIIGQPGKDLEERSWMRSRSCKLWEDLDYLHTPVVASE